MADIVGCISLAGAILQICYKYGSAVADSTLESKKLTDKVTSLTGLLTGIQSIVEDNDNHEIFDLERVILECTTELQTIKDRLLRYAPQAEHRKMQRSIKRFAWPFRRSETLAMIESVDKQRGALGFAMNALTYQALQSQDERLDQVATSIDDLQHLILDERDLRKQQEVFEWLTDYDQEAQHIRNCKIRFTNTCTWIDRDPDFATWLQFDRGLLWYQGGAGTGKTTLASHVIELLIVDNKMNGIDDALVYFYFDASTNQSLSLANLMASLVKQLALLHGLPRDVEHAFDQSCRGGTRKDPTAPMLEPILKEMVQSMKTLTLVVDAVDESNRPADICRFLGTIREWPSQSCRVFFTSRPGILSPKQFPQAVSLAATKSALQSDIAEYISQRLRSDARLQSVSSELRDEIEAKLLHNADGMIRWAQCLLDDISRLRTDRAMRAALQTLPRSLEESYVRMLSKVNEDDTDIARSALMWLSHSTLPLNLHAVAEAVVFEPQMANIDSSVRLHQPRDIVDIIPTLLSYNELSQEVRLSHHSVREFLTSSYKSTFACPSPTSHKAMAESCLSYILMDHFTGGPMTGPKLKQAMQDYPLLEYAARNWTYHLLSSDAELELQPLILRLMTPQVNPSYLFWLQVVFYHSVHGFTRPGIEGTSSNPAPIYYAASYGLYHTVASLIASGGTDINIQAGQYGGTPLHSACFRNRPRVAELLLDAGADPNIRDRNGNTAYRYMASVDRDSPLLSRLAPTNTVGCERCLIRGSMCDFKKPICGPCTRRERGIRCDMEFRGLR